MMKNIQTFTFCEWCSVYCGLSAYVTPQPGSLITRKRCNPVPGSKIRGAGRWSSDGSTQRGTVSNVQPITDLMCSAIPWSEYSTQGYCTFWYFFTWSQVMLSVHYSMQMDSTLGYYYPKSQTHPFTSFCASLNAALNSIVRYTVGPAITQLLQRVSPQ